MLAAAGRTFASLPADLKTGWQAGSLQPALLERYLRLDANWFTRLFMPVQGAPASRAFNCAWQHPRPAKPVPSVLIVSRPLFARHVISNCVAG